MREVVTRDLTSSRTTKGGLGLSTTCLMTIIVMVVRMEERAILTVQQTLRAAAQGSQSATLSRPKWVVLQAKLKCARSTIAA